MRVLLLAAHRYRCLHLLFCKSSAFHSPVLLVGPELTPIWIKIRGKTGSANEARICVATGTLCQSCAMIKKLPMAIVPFVLWLRYSTEAFDAQVTLSTVLRNYHG